MTTVAPSTASPFSICGFMRKKRETFTAALPKPSSAGVYDTTAKTRTVPFTATTQFRVAAPETPRRCALSG